MKEERVFFQIKDQYNNCPTAESVVGYRKFAFHASRV